MTTAAGRGSALDEERDRLRVGSGGGGGRCEDDGGGEGDVAASLRRT